MQSAYKSFHSTETALLRIQNDLLTMLNENKMAVLVLLDLTAAFDTIDHNILLHRLKERFGICQNALLWIQSYLKDRKQFVALGNHLSSVKPLLFGVPQGSVLGPLLFSLYISPVADNAKIHNLGYHFYADDGQFYISFESDSFYCARTKLEHCIADIKMWMNCNFLKLNDSKTEMLIIGSRYNLKNVSQVSIDVGDDQISSIHQVTSLGAQFDSELSMDRFVSSKYKTCMYHLRCISRIRRYLTFEAAKSLVHAFVISRLDYCNSLLCNVKQQHVKKLQTVLNYAARIIYSNNNTVIDHVTPLLKSLHWLPVKQRIKFKVLVITFNCIIGSAPEYLCSLIKPYNPTRMLRSKLKSYISSGADSKANNRYGERCFHLAAPALFNDLPDDIRYAKSLSIFKKLIKTWLFNEYYNNAD